MVSISNELCSFYANNHGYRHVPPNRIINRIKMNTTSDIKYFLQGANDMENAKINVPLFVYASTKCIWVEKSPQICKVIA